MEKLVNWSYRAFKGDPDVEFLYNQGTVGIKGINPKWRNYALVSLDYPPFFKGNRGWENDLFYFGYGFCRPFTPKDYQILKKKHSKIIIGVRFTTISRKERQKHWGLNTPDDIFRNDFRNPYPIDKLSKKLVSEPSVLENIPPFLFQTDCTFFLLEDHEIIDPGLYYFILHTTYTFCRKNKIIPTRFSVCDNSLNEDFPCEEIYHNFFRKKKQIKHFGLPRFETMTAAFYSGNDNSDEFKDLEFDYTFQRKKKFLFLNRRARYHRTAMILRLYEANLLDDFYFSWGDEDGNYDLNFRELIPHIDWSKYKPSGASNSNYLKHPFFEKAPYRLDCDLNLEEKGPPYFGPGCGNEGIYSFVQDSYISLVSETDISPHYTFLTEKTFKRFAWKHPFLIWGNPYSLEHLRNLGYRTFSPWINEEYDDIQNPKKRFDALFAEIERLSAMSLEDIHQMYLEMIPVLEHNFNHFNHSAGLERSFNRMIEKI